MMWSTHLKHVGFRLPFIAPKLFNRKGHRVVSSKCYSSNFDDHRNAHKRSRNHMEEYWGEAAGNITWHTKFNKVWESSAYPHSSWFPGGELNTCYNALDRHVEAGRGNNLALIYDSPVTDTIKKYSYAELLHEVKKLAGVMISMGVKKGDRVIIYMPMIPQSLIGMLACSRIGAPHAVVFGGFAAKELGVRLRHTEAKLVLTANYGIEVNRIVKYKPILDEAIKLSGLESIKTLIYSRPGLEPVSMKPARDFDWLEAVDKSNGHDCIPVPSDHPLYILYTSGTTGNPKGVVRSVGGHTVVLHWTMKWIYGMDNHDDVWWAASDLGWVVGHSYICYAPLLKGITTVLYEGKPVGTPDASQFFRVIHSHKVKGMFTAPTALRAIHKADPEILQSQQYSRESLKYLFVAGEHCDNNARIWAEKAFQAPVLDNWWQTETGSPIAATCVGLGDTVVPPMHSCGHPVPGYEVEVLSEHGERVGINELGRIVCKWPVSPGFMETLFKAEDQFHSLYFKDFPGYYDTMDAGYKDENGFVYVMAREDDVINVAGHRISTAALEEACLEHPDIVDTACVGIHDDLKGQVALALFVRDPNSKKTEKEIGEELIKLVKEVVGPVAAFRRSVEVTALPRTRSGKTLRKALSELAQGKEVKIPPTIENPGCLDGILASLHRHQLALGAKIIR